MRTEEHITILKKGGVGVLMTDTIYGIVGSALSQKTVERIYRVRKRSPDKPMIILIASQRDLKKFSVVLNKQTSGFLKKIWPGPVSMIMPCKEKRLNYLHRGTFTLAFRIPKDKRLQDLLKFTGPLVAPSANIEGMPPATTIEEAYDYFGKSIDFYEKGKVRKSHPSTLIEIKR